MNGRMQIERVTRCALLALSMPLAALPVAAQQRPDSGVFVVRLGRDTLAVEQYFLRGDTLRAVGVSRSPRTAVRQYTAVLGADGAVQGFATAAEGQAIEPRPLAVPGSIPLAGGMYVPYQLAVQRAHAARADNTRVTLLAGDNTVPIEVRRVSATSFALPNQFEIPMTVTTDSLARIMKVEVTGGTTVERVGWLDLNALTQEFRARDEAGRGLGPLSPLETAGFTIKGASITITYSRPSLRGRELAILAPHDRVWRTGANAATEFGTDGALRFGEVAVPAGAYSLFTIPSASAWTLILNKQTGQGGLDYDQAQDHATNSHADAARCAPRRAVDHRGPGNRGWRRAARALGHGGGVGSVQGGRQLRQLRRTQRAR